jgi:hypothetical protein
MYVCVPAFTMPESDSRVSQEGESNEKLQESTKPKLKTK